MSLEGGLIGLAEREVVELQEFLEGWISGALDDSEMTYRRFSDVLAQDFRIVPPAGETLDRDGLIGYMVDQHGKDENITRWVEDVQVRRLADGIVVAMFDEWQIRDGERRGSRISGILREAQGKPNGLEWAHIHETPIVSTS